MIQSSFPGITPKDDILSLLNLLASKNPTGQIGATILLHGGYDPCSEYPANATFWTNNIGCDSGFIPDSNNRYCYLQLPDEFNFQVGENYCRINHDSELLLFDTNSEVDEFMTLLNNGMLAYFALYHSCGHFKLAYEKVIFHAQN